MRRVTPERRVSISIAEADSDVRNMNRISSCAAPACRTSPICSAAGGPGGDVARVGSSPATASARRQGLVEAGGGALGDREPRRPPIRTLCSSTTPLTATWSSCPSRSDGRSQVTRHRLPRRAPARRSRPGSPSRPRRPLLDGGPQRRPRRANDRTVDALGRLEPRPAGPAPSAPDPSGPRRAWG